MFLSLYWLKHFATSKIHLHFQSSYWYIDRNTIVKILIFLSVYWKEDWQFSKRGCSYPYSDKYIYYLNNAMLCILIVILHQYFAIFPKCGIFLPSKRRPREISRNICACPSLDGRSNILISVSWTLREWCSHVFFTPSRSLRDGVGILACRLWDGVKNT